MSKRLDTFDTMIAKGSTDPFVHYARAMELRSLERTDEALAAFTSVAERFPAYVPTYLMGAQVAEQLGRTQDARRFLETGVSAARAAGDSKALSELSGMLAGLDD